VASVLLSALVSRAANRRQNRYPRHLRRDGRALCGRRARKRRLVTEPALVTCEECLLRMPGGPGW